MYSPEQNTDAVLRDMMNCMEQRLKIVETRSEKNTNEIRSVQQSVTVVQNVVEADHVKRASEITNETEWPSLGNVNAFPGPAKSAERRMMSEVVADPPGTLAAGEKMKIPLRTYSAGGATDEKSTNQNKKEEDDGFEYSAEQRRGMLRQKRHKDAIIGKKTDCLIKSGLKHTDMFIFRVHYDVDDDQLKQYLIDENVSVIKFSKVSHDDSLMKSYRVTIKYDDLGKVMNANFWPDGIGCRRFYGKRNS
jgi:hypothetical protein